jgi:formylmethanofuran dehydrogenase subunit B
MSPATVTTNVTCLGCGCACDDIDVVVNDGRIVEARNTCALGAAWFAAGDAPVRCLVDGHDAPLEDALDKAAELLTAARRTLVYLAPGLSCEAQRTGVGVADLLRGVIDSTTTNTALDVVLASQERGFASATLGELRNRADVIVFWAVDIERRYPRFTSRYAPMPVGMHLRAGRASRTVIAVDVGRATTLADADQRVVIDPADEVATLTALQTVVAAPTGERQAFANREARVWAQARDLATPLLAGQYVALVYDAEPDQRAARSSSRFDALVGLAQSLNHATRCAAIGLRAGDNRSGADAMLTAQTGYPLAVDFARGYPRYSPYDGSASGHLSRREVDAALILGDAGTLPETVAGALRSVRHVIIGPRASTSSPPRPSVAIDTGVPGIHSDGTALRTDDVPLPLRPSLLGPPSTESLVARLASALSGGK